MKRVIDGLTGCVFLCAVGIIAALGQDLPKSNSVDIKGFVKTVTHERTILVRGGQNIPPINHRLSVMSYDRQQRPIQSSVFGNGEKRISFDHSVRPAKVTVSYYDKNGNPANAPFVPHANAPDEAGLCPQFSIKTENDAVAKIERETEVCNDGTVRARNVLERDHENRLFRQSREDAKQRSWEWRYRYDDKIGEIVELIFVLNDLERPRYWQTVNYVDHRFDTKGNWISMVASSFDSTVPNKIVYQLVEKRIIEYYPD